MKNHEAIRKLFEKTSTTPEKKKANAGGRKRKSKKTVHEQGAGLHNKYLTYEQAKIFIADAVYITSASEYKDWVRIKGYKFLPLTPEYVYRAEWEGWPTYIGTAKPQPKGMKRLPYYEAKSIAQKIALKHDLTDGDCFKNWLQFSDAQYLLPPEERELPTSIPRHPQQYYDEWEGWPKFLGKGLRSKLEQVQEKAKLVAEANNDQITEYNGQPVFAITTGVDHMNQNMIKVVVNYDGLSQLIATCNNLQYDILSAYIFDKSKLPIILDDLATFATDKGDSQFLVRDMQGLLSTLSFGNIELPRHLF